MMTDVACLKIKVDLEARRRKKVPQAWRHRDETGRRILKVTSNNFNDKIMRLVANPVLHFDS